MMDRLELCPVEGGLAVSSSLVAAQLMLKSPDHVAALDRTIATWLHVIGKHHCHQATRHMYVRLPPCYTS